MERCIDSVLAQCGVDLECIVVDDCGTDESMKIVEGYDDARIKIVRHERNRGQAAARNSGFEQSIGEWIFYLDSDDWLPEGAIERLYREVSEEIDPGVDRLPEGAVGRLYREDSEEIDPGVDHLSEGAVGRLYREDSEEIDPGVDHLSEGAVGRLYREDSEEIDWVEGMFCRVTLDGESQADSGKAGRYMTRNEIVSGYYDINLSNATNKLINRRIAAVSFCEGLIFEDTLWCQQVYPRLNKIVVVNEPTYNHFMRENSTMRSSFSSRKVDSLLSVIKQIMAIKPDDNQKNTAVYLAMNLVKNLYLSEFSSDYRKQALERLWRTGVGEMRVNRGKLPPFTRLLSGGFGYKSDVYFRCVSGLYKVFLEIRNR